MILLKKLQDSWLRQHKKMKIFNKNNKIKNIEILKELKIKFFLMDNGFTEVINFPFTAENLSHA